MRPEDYVFGLGPMFDLDELERVALRLLPPPNPVPSLAQAQAKLGGSVGAGCAGTTAPAPRIVATRMKGQPIMETRQVQVGTKPGNVLLELTPEAANVLKALAGSICGPDSGPRRQISQIFYALEVAGVQGTGLRGKYGDRLQNLWIQ